MPTAMIGAYMARLPDRIAEYQAALAGALLGGGGRGGGGEEHVSADAMLGLLGIEG